MKNKKGFTLLELIITIIIVGLLALIAVPIYNSYTENAQATEAMMLFDTISNAQRMYYIEHGRYASETLTNKGVLLDVDVSNNNYFTEFSIEAD